MSVNSLKLSLVIPVYNEENHLKNCLDAIALQTVRPDEVIVVDNNSTDKSVKIAKSYPFVKVVSEKEQGIVYARNRGFEASRGELIGRIDADTILPEDWVARVQQFYADPTNKEHILTGGGYFYNIRLPRLNGWIQGQIAYRIIRLTIGHYHTWGSNLVIPQRVWDKVKSSTCIRNDIHEDVDFGIHASELEYKINYIEDLRVGVYAKRIWTERDQLKEALARWPQTMRVHQRKAWWVPSLGNQLLLKIIIPVGLAADQVLNNLTRR